MAAAEADDPSLAATLEKFRLYETRARFYVIGSSREKRWFRVLKIDRSEPSELNVSEDPVWYSLQEVKSLLQRIDEGNRSTGGLTFFTKAYGIAGCIKFLESYYLILVTKRRQIGCICGHAIYCIDESQMITIPHSSVQTDVATSKNELRYKKLLASVDRTKDFFYSYTYPIMQSLQQNVTSAGMKEMPYENLFVWNTFLTEPMRSRCRNTLWTVALVHGHFKQVRLSIFGREINVVLISRRSRHFAGTWYLKRGVNDHGKVANDVETEQIVFEEEAVQRYDPTYEATKLHFDDLAQRYGHPIIILNLIKTVEKRPREMMLRREYFNAVGYLNQNVPEEKKLRFIHWDFHKFAKSKSANVLGVLGKVAGEALDLTGFYYSGKPKVQKKRSTQLSRTSTARDGSLDIRVGSGDLSRLSSNADALSSTGFQDMRNEANKQEPFGDAPCYQTGVLRTNCIDCLDCTNVAQYAYGLAALGRQLHAMGLTHVSKIHPDSSIASALMEMYQSMGDALAHQYGGSAAHNTVFTERQGKWKATTQSREFLKSIKRYYSNAYADGEKQDAINLSAPGNNAFMGSGAALIPGTTLSPVPACKEDYSRMKLTSFDKLMGMTCSSIKNVRLHCDADLKLSGGVRTSGMAPDAAYLAFTTADVENGWYGGTLIYDQDENSGAYKHCSELCQGAVMDPFEHDPEKERH
ncbi:hypothetical protein C2845_PM14G00560 [Panicum miliaceum]|uniref:SAC domain-containing protein n=1 Tax=Panicum miliaceum TaxID=4540 RepID=A0A3L6PN05_PANMI|nr:hypothetical protein C2845_PM14G00560 [Panicum miliaceum]